MPPPPDAFQLSYVLEGQAIARAFRQSPVVIGRESGCDLVLPLPFVSRRHARIEWRGAQWFISDLESRSGTSVNGRTVADCPLMPEDQIVLGNTPPLALAMHFQSGPRKDDAAGEVVFDDRFQRADVSLSIQVDPYDHAPAVPSAQQLVGPLAVAGLFQRLVEFMLTDASLGQLLEKALDLALAAMAVEQGCVCLCEADLAAIALSVSRAQSGAAAAGLAVSRSIARECLATRQAILVTRPCADTRFAHAASIAGADVQAAICAPLCHAHWVQGFIYLDTRSPDCRLGAADLELLAALAGLVAVGIQQSRLREEILRQQGMRARLARYSSPQVVERILARERSTSSAMLVEQREVSVVFGDLSGFTSLSEDLPPAHVAQLLNDVFEQVSQAVFRHEGTLDKFMGDGLMAVFGAPLPQPDHARRAVAAALLIQEQMDRFNALRRGLPPLAMRIGINSGPAVAGDIGSLARRDYTVVGDTVNIASRLQSSVAQPGQVVIGPATYAAVRAVFPCAALPLVQLKGKQQPLQPYVVEHLHRDSQTA